MYLKIYDVVIERVRFSRVKSAKIGSLVKEQSLRNRLFGSDKDSHYLVSQINCLSPTLIEL